ncbi:MAG: hypothetical protein WA144_00185 [Candidatus Methanoperedens sp.]
MIIYIGKIRHIRCPEITQLPEGMVRLALNLFKASAAPDGEQRKENIKEK